MEIDLNHRFKGVNYIESPNQGGPFAPGLPDTIVIHYTAGANAESAIHTLCDRERKVSAHLVVGRDGAVTQLLPFNIVGWHAGRSLWRERTSLNQYSIGIEIDNAGQLSERDGRYESWFGQTYPACGGRARRTPQPELARCPSANTAACFLLASLYRSAIRSRRDHLHRADCGLRDTLHPRSRRDRPRPQGRSRPGLSPRRNARPAFGHRLTGAGTVTKNAGDAKPLAERAPAIDVRELSKTYAVPVREGGLAAALKSLVQRQTRHVEAVKQISFAVAPGEIVGFLGPNGAGKTTSLKMLSGLLHPSGGQGRVLGFEPFKRQRDFLRQITLVMGNRNQLLWDIPVIDSFERNRAIYRLERSAYRQTVEELTALLDLDTLLDKPVRNLSLGERMKCEIAAALLHKPQVLFLDEPTIGLDVTMQRRIRAFLTEYNQRYGATVLLTSHYMADVEALCKRVVVIHHGLLLFDGQLTELVQRFSPHKTIIVELENGHGDLGDYGEIVASSEGRVSLRVPKAETAQVTGRLLSEQPVLDLTVEDPPIEDVIEEVFERA